MKEKRAQTMARQILVALRSQDRLSEMMPYIEQVAHPGMKIVLLVPFSFKAAPGILWDNSLELQRVEEGRFLGELEKQGFMGRNIKAINSPDEPMLAVERKVILALEALIKRGVELTVDIYTGSLRRVLRSYTHNGNVDSIIKGPERALAIKQLVYGILPVFASFRQRAFPSIHLLRVNQSV
jgi:hypothetical protein